MTKQGYMDTYDVVGLETYVNLGGVALCLKLNTGDAIVIRLDMEKINDLRSQLAVAEAYLKKSSGNA